LTPVDESFLESLPPELLLYGLLVTILALLGAVVYLLRRNRSLQRLAALDALTGLSNRMLLDEILDREVARATRQSTPLCVAMVDLDHFKRVNDRFGHLEGDRVLVAIAGILRRGVRSSDVVGRWGGEEFLVILPDTVLPEASSIVERLRDQLAGHSLQKVGTVTVSAGIAELLPGEGRATLVGRADRALYRAKDEGRNRSCVWDESNPLAAPST